MNNKTTLQRIEMESPPPPVRSSATAGERILLVLSFILIVITFPFSMCMCLMIIHEYQRAVIFRMGRIQKDPKGPGVIFVIPCTDTIRRIDMRTVSFDVPPQEALTKDSVTVSVDAAVYYRVYNPLKAVMAIADYCASSRLVAATTLRNVLGTKILTELLTDRPAISLAMRMVLDEATYPWGVIVERVEIKDVRLPVQLQRAMAAEAEATREARAKIVTAEGEIKASLALKEAASNIANNTTALQLRYLQALTTMSSNKTSVIVFPFPLDMSSLLGSHSGTEPCRPKSNRMSS